jgi:hypothetical protein
MACVGMDRQRGEYIRCAQCSTPFYRLRSMPTQRFCSKSCAATARNLTNANPAKRQDITGERNPMHGHGDRVLGKANGMFNRRKEAAPRWNGGRKVRKDGYVFVVAPSDHPHPSYVKASGLKYVLEHRRVMEVHIGRYLHPEEVVHHRDGDKTHNAIDNLELLGSKSEHSALHWRASH